MEVKGKKVEISEIFCCWHHEQQFHSSESVGSKIFPARFEQSANHLQTNRPFSRMMFLYYLLPPLLQK